MPQIPPTPPCPHKPHHTPHPIMHHIVNFRQAALEDKLEQFDQHGEAETDQQDVPSLHAFEGAEQKADGNEGKDIHNHLDQNIIPSFPNRLVAPKGREVVGPFHLGASDKGHQVKEQNRCSTNDHPADHFIPFFHSRTVTNKIVPRMNANTSPTIKLVGTSRKEKEMKSRNLSNTLKSPHLHTSSSAPAPCKGSSGYP